MNENSDNTDDRFLILSILKWLLIKYICQQQRKVNVSKSGGAAMGFTVQDNHFIEWL